MTFEDIINDYIIQIGSILLPFIDPDRISPQNQYKERQNYILFKNICTFLKRF